MLLEVFANQLPLHAPLPRSHWRLPMRAALVSTVGNVDVGCPQVLQADRPAAPNRHI